VWGPAGGRRVATCLHEAMARFAPSQPNEGMARIALRSPMVPMVPMVNNKIELDQSYVLGTTFEIVLEG